MYFLKKANDIFQRKQKKIEYLEITGLLEPMQKVLQHWLLLSSKNLYMNITF